MSGAMMIASASYAAPQSTVALTATTAVVNTTEQIANLGNSFTAKDFLERFEKVISNDHRFQNVQFISTTPEQTTTDVNGVKTVANVRSMFVGFKNSRLPALLLKLEQRAVVCPASLPTGITCSPSVSMVLTGPLASYEGVTAVGSGMDAESAFNGKQSFSWSLSASTTAATLTGTMTILSPNTFERNFQAYIQQYAKDFNKSTTINKTTTLSQAQILGGAAAFIRSINERIFQ